MRAELQAAQAACGAPASPAQREACARRDALADEIVRFGLCHGRRGVIGAEVHRCTARSDWPGGGLPNGMAFPRGMPAAALQAEIPGTRCDAVSCRFRPLPRGLCPDAETDAPQGRGAGACTELVLTLKDGRVAGFEARYPDRAWRAQLGVARESLGRGTRWIVAGGTLEFGGAEGARRVRFASAN
ncbi:hypothetical protein [Falsiroseomonas sp. HW251]|uniref:hypothetical protein n=1 Tax=Falsiroseomonas sp. HW251 TaxID=3390998 RepID=UPI003D31DD85